MDDWERILQEVKYQLETRKIISWRIIDLYDNQYKMIETISPSGQDKIYHFDKITNSRIVGVQNGRPQVQKYWDN